MPGHRNPHLMKKKSITVMRRDITGPARCARSINRTEQNRTEQNKNVPLGADAGLDHLSAALRDGHAHRVRLGLDRESLRLHSPSRCIAFHCIVLHCDPLRLQSRFIASLHCIAFHRIAFHSIAHSTTRPISIRWSATGGLSRDAPTRLKGVARDRSAAV